MFKQHKKLKTISIKLCLALFSLSLISCVSVQIKDEEVCNDIGAAGAACAHTISTATRDIPKAQWDVERYGQLCMQSSAYAEFKSEILQLCEVSNSCNYEEVKKSLDALDARLRR